LRYLQQDFTMNDPEASAEQTLVSEPGDGGSYAVFRNRDFSLYLTARFIASLGQQMLSYAVGWELYQRTHSMIVLSLVGVSQMVPMIVCTLPAGHVADNFNRKKIILTTNLLAGIGSGGLALISAAQYPVAWIYVCLVAIGAARTFLWPASASFLPHIVPRNQFARAVTFSSATFQLSSIMGPALGGILIEYLVRHSSSAPASRVYALNALASIACFVMVALIRRDHTVKERQRLSFTNLAAGFKFVFQNKIILGLITLDMFAVLLGGATSLLPSFAADILHTGPGGLGLLTSAMAIGAVVCAFYLAHRPPMQKAGRDMLWSVAIFGIGTIVFGFSQYFWLSFAMLFICGAFDNISVVVRQTVVQLLTPDEKRGRVSAVNSLFIGTSNQLGDAEAAFVAFLFGPWSGHSNAQGAIVSTVIGGVGTILVVIAVAWIWPEIRKYGRLE
jgi:MFS family permease